MRICFYSGYRETKGGFTTLLVTLISELYARKQPVLLINYRGGIIERELLKNGVEIDILDLETMSWQQVADHIQPTDVFVITTFAESLRHLLTKNPRVIYYDINDFIGRISDYKFGIHFKSLGRKLLQKLLQHQSLAFMDDSGLLNLQSHFSLRVPEPFFLPIPVKVATVNDYLQTHEAWAGVLKLTYIGRSVDWKMMPLHKILTDLSSIATVPVQFSIVVDDASAFRHFIKPEDFEKDGFLHIEVLENIEPSQIPTFLKDNAHLHFAMGTAALDAAKIGVPTILVDYSVKPFAEDYTYKWLYQTKDFSLGRNLLKTAPDKGMPLNEIITKFVSDAQQRVLHSEQCYNYVKANHSAEMVVAKLLSLAQNATFRLQDAKPYIPFYFKLHALLKAAAGFVQLKAGKQ